MRLAVELDATLIGSLDGDSRSFDFHPHEEGIERFGVNSSALSVAIPLVPAPRRDQAPRRRNWFSELLPEGDQYDYLLAQAGIRRGDTLAFLARYGRDVTGALQVWDLDDPGEPVSPDVRPLTDAQVRTLLDDPLGTPLGNDATLGRSSLGGVQPKVVLTRTPDGWSQPLGGFPSTHIIKPRLSGDLSTVIYDEEFGARLMRQIGLAAFSTSVETFDGLPALVIERFDRSDGYRIHQEDFSQVLGAERNEKYQEVGGVVNLKRIAEILRRHAQQGDVRRLAEMVTAAVALGNLDMHTKNLGLLHPVSGEVLLAPAYDFVPQAPISGDGKLALAVNGKYRLNQLTLEDLVAEFASWPLRNGESIARNTLSALEATVASETPLAGARPWLQDQIGDFVDNLLGGRPVVA